MMAARAHPLKPVPTEMADYNGFRYAVGGGAAFFLGLLTAGLYPGVAVITRLRRHRADESRLYFRMVDRLRERLGRSEPLAEMEALADRMRRKAGRGVLAILAAVAVSVTILAAGPALVITYNAYRGVRVTLFGESHYYAETEVLTTAATTAALVAAFLAVWAVLAMSALGSHRRRTVALLRAYNHLAQQQHAPPIRIYPAGMSAGQVCWLILTVLFSAVVGLTLAGLLELAYPRFEEQTFVVLLMGLSAVVLPTYVWVAMVWSNHVRRWNRTVLASLSESLGRLLRSASAGPDADDQPRFCRSPTCGAANRAQARYCGRCGQPL